MTTASGQQRQLLLDLPHLAAMGREDFLLSPANRVAVDAVEAWPDWPQRALAVVGPAGAGKSHLMEVWRTHSGAVYVPAAVLAEAIVADATACGAIAVEDIDRGIADERVLFHLLNLARETRLSVLLTSRVPLGDIEIALPDLRSRLRAMALVSIEPPDQALLQALLVKLFADRQLAVEPAVISMLVLRMERSADAARHIVDVIDQLAVERRRRVTTRLARDALAICADRVSE